MAKVKMSFKTGFRLWRHYYCLSPRPAHQRNWCKNHQLQFLFEELVSLFVFLIRFKDIKLMFHFEARLT